MIEGYNTPLCSGETYRGPDNDMMKDITAADDEETYVEAGQYLDTRQSGANTEDSLAGKQTKDGALKTVKTEPNSMEDNRVGSRGAGIKRRLSEESVLEGADTAPIHVKEEVEVKSEALDLEVSKTILSSW